MKVTSTKLLRVLSLRGFKWEWSYALGGHRKIVSLPSASVFRVGENLKFSFHGKVGRGAILLEQGKCEIGAGLPWLLGDLIKPVTLGYDEDMGIRIDVRTMDGA